MKRGFELITRDFHTARDIEEHLHRAIMKSGLGLARSVSLISKDCLFILVRAAIDIRGRQGAETWLEAKFGEDIAALRTLIRCIVALSCQPLGALKHDFALPFFLVPS